MLQFVELPFSERVVLFVDPDLLWVSDHDLVVEQTYSDSNTRSTTDWNVYHESTASCGLGP